MDSVNEIVCDEIRRLAELRGLDLPSLAPGRALIDDLGLKSLDLAHLVAALERRLKVDPFLTHVPITQIRTVADLCAAYRLALGIQ